MKKHLLLLLLIASCQANAMIWYVTPGGSGNFDGTSWNNAAMGSSLQATIDAANSGDQVWVSCGTYLTSAGTDRNISFGLKNDVAVYGSFVGTETQLSERQYTCGPCSILSAEIGSPGIGDNAYHVFHNLSGLDNSAVLDGFVVQDANDDRFNSIDEGLGGGIYNHGGFSYDCSPMIRNCVITNNYAQFGAGIFNSGHSGGNASPSIINCIIANNHAYIGGGGIDNFGLGGNASPSMINCLVYGNTAVQRAGGMYCWGGNGGNASPEIINCVFAKNTAVDGGALVLDNENSPPGSFSGTSNPTPVNSIFWENTATGVGPQFYLIGSASFTATYSDVDLSTQSAPHVLSGAGTGNFDQDPHFVDLLNPKGLDNCWFTEDDGLGLLLSSGLINGADLLSAPVKDIIGRNRIENPDIGAYETEYVTGVNQLGSTNFVVYPNPSIDWIKIEFNDDQTHEIVLYTVEGKYIQSASVLQTFELNLSAFEAGTYILRVDGYFVQKISKTE